MGRSLLWIFPLVVQPGMDRWLAQQQQQQQQQEEVGGSTLRWPWVAPRWCGAPTGQGAHILRRVMKACIDSPFACAHKHISVRRMAEVAAYELCPCIASCPTLCCPTLSHATSRAGRVYDEYDIADRLRMRGWVVPAYEMPANAE